MADSEKKCDRRSFVGDGLRVVGAFGLVGFGGVLYARKGQRGEALWRIDPDSGALHARKGHRGETLWQIDPNKCVACGNCANYCVLDESAVKCVHSFPVCGYCKLCTGYFDPEPVALDSGAENQLCPTGALIRTFIEDPYFEYKIDKDLCIGCGKCVKGCSTFGNGSLYLQICHERCVNCNECSIGVACPSGAISRVQPDESPYKLKHVGESE